MNLAVCRWKRQGDHQLTGKQRQLDNRTYPLESLLEDQHSGLLCARPSRWGTAWMHWHSDCNHTKDISIPSVSGNRWRLDPQLFADIKSLLDELDEAQLDDNIGVCTPLRDQKQSQYVSTIVMTPAERSTRHGYPPRCAAWQVLLRILSSSCLEQGGLARPSGS